MCPGGCAGGRRRSGAFRRAGPGRAVPCRRCWRAGWEEPPGRGSTCCGAGPGRARRSCRRCSARSAAGRWGLLRGWERRGLGGSTCGGSAAPRRGPGGLRAARGARGRVLPLRGCEVSGNGPMGPSARGGSAAGVAVAFVLLVRSAGYGAPALPQN